MNAALVSRRDSKCNANCTFVVPNRHMDICS